MRISAFILLLLCFIINPGTFQGISAEEQVPGKKKFAPEPTPSSADFRPGSSRNPGPQIPHGERDPSRGVPKKFLAERIVIARKRIAIVKTEFSSLEEKLKVAEASRDRIEGEARKIITGLLNRMGQFKIESDPWLEYKRLRNLQYQDGSVAWKKILEVEGDRFRDLKIRHEAAANEVSNRQTVVANRKEKISKGLCELANLNLDLKERTDELAPDWQSAPSRPSHAHAMIQFNKCLTSEEAKVASKLWFQAGSNWVFGRCGRRNLLPSTWKYFQKLDQK